MTARTNAWRRTTAVVAAFAVAGSLGLPTLASAQALRTGASTLSAIDTGRSATVEQVQYLPRAPNAPRGYRAPPPNWRGGGPGRGWRGPGWRGPGYYQSGWGGPGWRGPGYYGPRYYNYGYRDNGGAVAAGIIGGLAVGAIAAGAAQQNANNRAAYCAQRYRSYDPRSGTYLGYDGLRHPC